MVIGILIALGINNWNENRINRNEENVFLIQINNDLAIDSLQFAYYKQQFNQIDKLHLELFNLGQAKNSIDSISEPTLIRRTLYFKQLIDSDFNEKISEINNPKINEALIKYIGSVKDMEDIYLVQLSPLVENRLKPLLYEQELYNTENWFALKNRNFKDKSYKRNNGKNLLDKNKFIELAKKTKFQQLLFELNLKWNDFNARLEIVIEENLNLRKLIQSELKNY